MKYDSQHNQVTAKTMQKKTMQIREGNASARKQGTKGSKNIPNGQIQHQKTYLHVLKMEA